MKLSMLKILLEKAELSPESKEIIDTILADAGDAEALTVDQSEKVTQLLEAELALSQKVIEGYEGAEEQLTQIADLLRQEEKEAE